MLWIWDKIREAHESVEEKEICELVLGLSPKLCSCFKCSKQMEHRQLKLYHGYLNQEKGKNVCPQQYDAGDKDEATVEEDCWHKQHNPIALGFFLSKFYSCSLEKVAILLFECFVVPLISLD